MKRYVKAVLGGLLAILAAFGCTVAIVYWFWWKPEFLGLRVSSVSAGPKFWALLCLIFSVGFYFAFRAAYGSNSK